MNYINLVKKLKQNICERIGVQVTKLIENLSPNFGKVDGRLYFSNRCKQRLGGYVSSVAVVLICGWGITAQAQTNLTLTKQAVDPVTGAAITSVNSGGNVLWVVTTSSSTSTEPTSNVVLADTTTGGSQTYVGSTLQKAGGAWTLANLAAGSTLSSTTIATWNAALNQVTAGSGGTSPIAAPMIQLFGNNAVIGASTYPGASLPAPTGSGDGFKPITFTNSVGDVIEVSANHLGNAIFCTNVTKAINCSGTYPQAAGLSKQVIFNIGSKVYMSNGGSSVLCYDYSQVGVGAVTQPTSCGTSAALAFGGIGSIFVQGGNVWATSWDYGRMTCLTGSLAFCNTTDAASTYNVGYANYGYMNMIDLNGGSTVVFGARSLNTSVPSYDVCVNVSGTTVTDCAGTHAAISTIASGGTTYPTQLPTTSTGWNNLIPINDATGQTGWCDIPFTTTSQAVCFGLNGNVITTPTLPTFAAGFAPRYNTGQAYYSVPNSSYLLWGDEENGVMNCWNWATSSSCGSVTAAEKPYGAYYLLGTGAGPGTANACYVTTGDTGSLGFQYYQINPTLMKVPVSTCLPATVMGQYSVSDPKSNYCAPTTSVLQWDSLKLTSTTSATNSTAVALPANTVVEYYASNGTTLLGSVTVTSAMLNAAGNIATIPYSSLSSFLSYANNSSLVIKVKGSGTAAYIAAQQNYTTSGNATPQICLQTTVTCTSSTAISNSVTASGGAVATGASPSTGLNCVPAPALTVTKTATPSSFTVGASGQTYTIKVDVTAAPTTATTLITDNLPTGVTTAGAPTLVVTNGGTAGATLTGCPTPAVGNTTITGCTLSSPLAVGTYTITVPVSVASSALGATGGNNTANASGGGSTCTATSAAPCTSTVVVPVAAAPTVAITKSISSAATVKAGTFNFTVTGATAAVPASGTTASTDTVTTTTSSYTAVPGQNVFTGTAGTQVSFAETTNTAAFASGATSSNAVATVPLSMSCTDSNQAASGTAAFVTITASPWVLSSTYMKANATWVCNFINGTLPRISLQKKSVGGTGTFNFTLGGVQ